MFDIEWDGISCDKSSSSIRIELKRFWSSLKIFLSSKYPENLIGMQINFPRKHFGYRRVC